MFSIHQFIQIYKDAFSQLKKEWGPLFSWLGIWYYLLSFCTFLLFSWASNEDLYAYFIEGRFGSFVWVIALLLLSVLSCLIIYSFMGAVLNPEGDDDDLVVIRRGIQGFLHPYKALRSSLALFVGPAIPIFIIFVGLGRHSEIYSFTRILESFFHQTAGYIISIIVLILLIAIYFYYISGAVYSSFIMMENPDCGCIESIQKAIKKIHGKRAKAICLMVPVVIVMFFTVWFMIGCHQTSQYPRLIEQAMAVQTQHALQESNDQDSFDLAEKTGLTEKERRQIKRGLAFEIYTKPKPDFSGDLPEYIHQLADYGLSREKFYAHRDQTEISELAMIYEDHPIVGRHWGILLFLAWAALGFESLIAVLLLVQYYRSDDYQKEIEPPKEKANVSPKEENKAQGDTAQPEHGNNETAKPSSNHQQEPLPPTDTEDSPDPDPEFSERPTTIDPGFNIPNL